jgi:hypothetical protein
MTLLKETDSTWAAELFARREVHHTRENRDARTMLLMSRAGAGTPVPDCQRAFLLLSIGVDAQALRADSVERTAPIA